MRWETIYVHKGIGVINFNVKGSATAKRFQTSAVSVLYTITCSVHYADV
jgi:hypothetical protein